ncbi:MAG: GrpB family protein [Thermoplasmata archaeon]
MKGPVMVVDYIARWPIMYEEEERRILRAIGPYVLAIEHVGSTAVPGLGAKPIIDILAAVHRLKDAESCIGPLEGLGYEYVPEYEDLIPERRYFHKGPQEARTHHLHMVEMTSDFWEKHLLFRDFLRTHAKVAQEYFELKRELAARYRTDRDAYTDAKTSFIESVIARARTSQEERTTTG